MTTSTEDMLSLFEKFQKYVEEEQARREVIQESARDLEQHIRQMMTIIQGIHQESGIKDSPKVISRAKDLVGPCGQVYQKLSSGIPPKEYYKYHEIWRGTTQKAVFCIALIEFLQSGKLASREQVAAELTLKIDQAEGFHLDLEDYLHGLLQLVSELSRLAVNSAACGDYDRPVAISQFVNELNAGFRLLNFKNDSLRKHYDCFKYDLKKIEEVVYDLSIRGLKSSENKSSIDVCPTSNIPENSEMAA
ncbi:translin [Halyomorpha halys]|uniref:translin n=1 Tax=Halyomorpha halys TaxID=286706 RepID=UPI0006D4E46F|nr:translin [Halyomorpha halys]